MVPKHPCYFQGFHISVDLMKSLTILEISVLHFDFLCKRDEMKEESY